MAPTIGRALPTKGANAGLPITVDLMMFAPGAATLDQWAMKESRF
jgi:hypothetical protein